MWFLDGLLYVRKIFSDEQRWVQFRLKSLKRIQTAVQLFSFQKASPVSLTLAIMVELVHKIRTHSNALVLLGGEGLHVIKVSQVCAVMYVHVQVHTVCMNTLYMCRYILYILYMLYMFTYCTYVHKCVSTFCICVYTSAGPDLLNPLNPRTYFFHCFASGAKRSLRIFRTRILVMDLSYPMFFYFFTIHSLCQVLDYKIYYNLILN